MNDPCPDTLCLLVMISSVKAGRRFDATCLLEKGDHEFIDHKSYCVYRLAMQSLAAHIGRMVNSRVYIAKADFPPKTFCRIADGLYQSPETKRSIVRYAEDQNI